MKLDAWACTSLGTCITGLVLGAIPYLQAIALLISIAAGIRAILSHRKKDPP